MTWAIPLSNFINLVSDFINQILRFTNNLITDMGLDLKSPKVIAGFGCSFLTTCIFVLLFAVSLNYLWSPLKAELPQSTNIVDITNETKIVNSLVLANISEDTPNENVNEKALVRSRSNSQIENDDSDMVLPYGNRMRLNFLPDTHDLRVYDDADEFNSLETFHHPFKKDVPPQNDQEATRALHMALQMKHIGKDEKAKKLFQHALALNPYHPDVLNHYGEFLEEHNKDVINANRFYTRALVLAPLHNKALQNRERTLPVVEDLDEKQLSRIDNKRDYLIQIPDNDASLKRVKKEAYFQHIYHTVAIEGNTMTLAETRMVVETRMAVPGKSIMEHNEIIGLESALKYINSTLVSKVGRLLVSDILQIHKRVLGHVDPLEAGSFRTSQVYVGEHTPPPASDVQGLMEEFVDWINSEDAFNLHPVKFAAIAHYKLVNIHPFIDGNGRSARLLMNLLLMRNGYPPVIIRKQDRSLYYEFLQMANEGDIRPFIRFIAKCTERTLDVYLYATEYGNSVTGMRALGGQDSENHDLEHQVKIIEV